MIFSILEPMTYMMWFIPAVIGLSVFCLGIAIGLLIAEISLDKKDDIDPWTGKKRRK